MRINQKISVVNLSRCCQFVKFSMRYFNHWYVKNSSHLEYCLSHSYNLIGGSFNLLCFFSFRLFLLDLAYWGFWFLNSWDLFIWHHINVLWLVLLAIRLHSGFDEIVLRFWRFVERFYGHWKSRQWNVFWSIILLGLLWTALVAVWFTLLVHWYLRSVN